MAAAPAVYHYDTPFSPVISITMGYLAQQKAKANNHTFISQVEPVKNKTHQ